MKPRAPVAGRLTGRTGLVDPVAMKPRAPAAGRLTGRTALEDPDGIRSDMRNAGRALAQATHRSHRPRGPRYIDPGDARGYPQRLSAGEGVTVDSLKGRVGVVTGGASGIGRA